MNEKRTPRRVSGPALVLMIPLLVLSAGFFASAADDAGALRGVPDIFDATAARRPAAGEWLEYLVAYPVDPLENRLHPRPLPPPPASSPAPAAETGGQPDPIGDHPDFIPVFEPPAVWRSVPLRLEVLGTEDDGTLRVRMTFAGTTQETALPLPARAEDDPYQYDHPQPEDGRTVHRLVGGEVEVTVRARRGDGYGFVRHYNRDLPFGIARFATPDVDLILIGYGTGEPPAFPLAGQPEPAPGTLYQTVLK